MLVVEQERQQAVALLARHVLGAMQSKQRHLSADPMRYDERLPVRFPTKQPMPNAVQRTTRVLRKTMR